MSITLQQSLENVAFNEEQKICPVKNQGSVSNWEGNQLLLGEISILHNRKENLTFKSPLGPMKVVHLGTSSCPGVMEYEWSLDGCGACSFFL